MPQTADWVQQVMPCHMLMVSLCGPEDSGAEAAAAGQDIRGLSYHCCRSLCQLLCCTCTVSGHAWNNVAPQTVKEVVVALRNRWN